MVDYTAQKQEAKGDAKTVGLLGFTEVKADRPVFKVDNKFDFHTQTYFPSNTVDRIT
jgi:hypothetical protein